MSHCALARADDEHIVTVQGKAGRHPIDTSSLNLVAFHIPSPPHGGLTPRVRLPASDALSHHFACPSPLPALPLVLPSSFPIPPTSSLSSFPVPLSSRRLHILPFPSLPSFLRCHARSFPDRPTTPPFGRKLPQLSPH